MSRDHQHSKGVASAVQTAQRPPLRPRLLSSLTRQLGAAVLVAFLGLVATATTSHAWQCLRLDQAIAIALCENSVCSEGFGIDYVLTYRGCVTRPVVRALPKSGLTIFARSARHSYHRQLSGVYEAEVSYSCLREGWRSEQCITLTSIRRLSKSVDLQTLEAYRSEWLDREQQANRSHFSTLLIVAALMLALTILVIAWPWALGAWIPAFRRRIGWTLLVAIPIQVLMGLYILGSFAMGLGPVPVLWMRLGEICAIAIVVAIPMQLGAFIRRKLKARARPA